MPKIIENLKERLMEEAKAQLAQDGCSAMTIRSVVRSCVDWAKENNVELIDASHMKIIKDKQA